MPILLYRLVAMPIVKLTVSSNLLILEDDFVHSYREGATMFYLSTINEASLVNKVLDKDLES
jgi:hypothetical protein